MSDQTTFAQPPGSSLAGHDDPKQEMSAPDAAAGATTAQKRKREAGDHGDGTGDGDRDGAGHPSFKRASPGVAHGNDGTGDAPLAAPNHVDDDQAGAAQSLDFSALAQHNHQQNGTSAASDATSTAAAALAGIYPSLTVPQPTDMSFASTGSGGEGETSFHIGDGDGQQGAQHFDMESLGREAHTGRESAGGQKPQVGTEEWHRVRRDNHKEGKPFTPPQRRHGLTTFS